MYVENLKSPGRWRLIASGGVLAVIITGTFLLSRDPGISASAANGSYRHDCCGTLLLDNGRMTFETTKSVDYVIRQDEEGPYLLPDTYVGPWEERGFQIDGSRDPLKLRLDVIPRPNTIELYDAGRSYSFKRKHFKARAPRRG